MPTKTSSTINRRSFNNQNKANRVSILSYKIKTGNIKSQIQLHQNLFSFLLEGEKTVYYAGTQVSIKPGKFLLLSAGNCLMSEKIAANGGSYRSMLIFFDNTILTDFFTRHPEIPGGKFDKKLDVPFLQFEKDAYLVNYIASLDLMLAAKKTVSEDMGKIKLEELLFYLSEFYPGQIKKLRSVSQQAEDDILIRHAVTANINNNITVEELAFLCNTSLSTFKRRFARIYGSSPYKWLLEKRMQKAAQMLKNRKHKASDIYYEMGFENLSSFIQSFKQVYGITPRQYQLSH